MLLFFWKPAPVVVVTREAPPDGTAVSYGTALPQMAVSHGLEKPYAGVAVGSGKPDIGTGSF